MTFREEKGVTKWISVEAAALRAGVDRRTILRWIEDKKIVARKLGSGVTSAWLVDGDSLSAWLKESGGDQG